MANSNGATELGNTPPPDTLATGAPRAMGGANTPERNRKDYIKEGFNNKTKGEERFNYLTYTGVGYFGVTGVSVFLTWLLNDSSLLSGWFKNLKSSVATYVAERPNNAILKPFNGKTNSIMSIGALFTGGTIVSVGLVKWLEDNKARLVKSYDTQIYGEAEVASNPEIQKAHAELEAAPKQTWTSVFVSRLTAFAATLGTWLAVGSKNSPLERATSNPTHNKAGWSLDRLAITVGRGAEGIVRPSRKSHIEVARKAVPHDVSRGSEAPDGTLSRVLSYFAQDGLYTLITSQALWVSTRIFAPFFDKPHTSPATPAPALADIKHNDAPPATPTETPVAATRRDTPDAQVSPERAHQGQGVASPDLGLNEPALAAAR